MQSLHCHYKHVFVINAMTKIKTTEKDTNNSTNFFFVKGIPLLVELDTQNLNSMLEKYKFI